MVGKMGRVQGMGDGGLKNSADYNHKEKDIHTFIYVNISIYRCIYSHICV